MTCSSRESRSRERAEKLAAAETLAAEYPATVVLHASETLAAELLAVWGWWAVVGRVA